MIVYLFVYRISIVLHFPGTIFTGNYLQLVIHRVLLNWRIKITVLMPQQPNWAAMAVVL